MERTNRYPHLFAPIKLGNVILQNRIVANPMSERFDDRTLGGPGVVICGHTLVDEGRSSWMSPDEPYAFSKYQVEEAKHRVLKAKRTGARASIELAHSGKYSRVRDYAMGPCGYVREDGVEVKAMTEEMMRKTADCWAQAARDAKDVGFDMVFLHFGHGWLMSEFLSPLFNHRTDDYGGSLENRMRFPLQVLAACRDAVGPGFPMEMRVSAHEWMPGGIEFEDVVAFCREAQRYVTSIQVSSGLDLEIEANVHMAATNFDSHHLNAEWARAIKEAVDIPITLIGSIETPEEAEELIASGTCDMVAMARALAADPFWPEKAREGRPEDIVPCIRCLQCYHISTNRRNVGCSVNPRYANEDFVPLKLDRGEKSKRVLVVGGGPGGMKAALTASERGHRVTLVEKQSELGGQLRYISQEAHKEDVARLLAYFRTQIAKSDVEVLLDTEATPELVREMDVDAVIIAVGSNPVKLNLPGTESDNVFGFHDAIEHIHDLGERVVIVGGGTIGAEIALELAEMPGKDVTLVASGDKIAELGNRLYRVALRQMFEKHADSLHVIKNAYCIGVENGVARLSFKSGGEEGIPFDSAILATGVRANSAVAEELFGLVPQSFTIGDCVRPRKIMDAVFEGYSVAANL